MLRRREAIRIHRTYMDDFYGPGKPIRQSRDAMEDAVEDNGGEEWSDDESAENNGAMCLVLRTRIHGESVWPRSQLGGRCRTKVVIDDYGTKDLIPALQRGLSAESESSIRSPRTIITSTYAYGIESPIPVCTS